MWYYEKGTTTSGVTIVFYISFGYSLSMSLALVQHKVLKANRTHVAREVGVTRKHVSEVLGGKKEPSFPLAAKLAEEIGITLDELYQCWTSLKKAA